MKNICSELLSSEPRHAAELNLWWHSYNNPGDDPSIELLKICFTVTVRMCAHKLCQNGLLLQKDRRDSWKNYFLFLTNVIRAVKSGNVCLESEHYGNFSSSNCLQHEWSGKKILARKLINQFCCRITRDNILNQNVTDIFIAFLGKSSRNAAWRAHEYNRETRIQTATPL